jgi:uncharacterized protein
MNLLIFSDLHSDLEAAQRLVRLSNTVDVLIGAGDFCNAHRHLSTTIAVLRAVTKPAILVAGNNETTDELAEACRDWPTAIVLHGSGIRVAGIDFYGIGGGIPVTPFGAWSYDFTEPEASKLLADCPTGCVLVSHSPPYGTVDRSSRDISLGSTAVRDAIERYRPKLVVCGHIHACAGLEGMIGPSPVINAGPDGKFRELAIRA